MDQRIMINHIEVIPIVPFEMVSAPVELLN